jgi:O-methyltransferase domain
VTSGSVTDQEEYVRALQAMVSLATPMAVRVAATLWIADHVAATPQTASELADMVNAEPDALERVLRHLTTVGVFTCDERGRYSATRLGDLLRDDHPSRLRRHLDIDVAVGHADLSFVQLLHSVRTGEPAFPVQFGRTFWDELSADEALAMSYHALMGADVTVEAPDILSAYDWGSLGHVVDVGGGNGALLIAMLTEYPTLRGTVVDLPSAAESARRAFTKAGFADRADAVAGSFFDPLPAGAGRIRTVGDHP